MDDLPVGVMVGATTSQKLHYVEPDHLGTPRVVIDPVRNVAVWTWELKGEAFGNTVPNQDPDANGTAFVFNMRYDGQRYDAASGLNYNMRRDFDPASGRYVESDPIGLRGGISSYSYVGGRPLDHSDFSGLFYVSNTPYQGNRNTIACDGIGGIMPILQGFDEISIKCGINDCVLAHENSHKADVVKSNPNICFGKAKNLTINAGDEAELKQTEIAAHDVEISCLRRKLHDTACDALCKTNIQKRIREVQKKRNKYE